MDECGRDQAPPLVAKQHIGTAVCAPAKEFLDCGMRVDSAHQHRQVDCAIYAYQYVGSRSGGPTIARTASNGAGGREVGLSRTVPTIDARILAPCRRQNFWLELHRWRPSQFRFHRLGYPEKASVTNRSFCHDIDRCFASMFCFRECSIREAMHLVQ